MSLIVSCPEEDSNRKNFNFRYDENPPIPFIESIDINGLVSIRFNSTMQPEVAEEDFLFDVSES